MSTSRIRTISTNVSNVGWVVFRHHFPAITWSLPVCQPTTLLIFSFSTRITFILLMSAILWHVCLCKFNDFFSECTFRYTKISKRGMHYFVFYEFIFTYKFSSHSRFYCYVLLLMLTLWVGDKKKMECKADGEVQYRSNLSVVRI